MDVQPKSVLRRKDRMNLAKAFWERAGLILVPHGRQNRFGCVAYSVDVPRGFPGERASRIARQIITMRPRLGIGHVRNRLLELAGDYGSPWSRSRRYRDPPPWLRSDALKTL